MFRLTKKLDDAKQYSIHIICLNVAGPIKIHQTENLESDGVDHTAVV